MEVPFKVPSIKSLITHLKKITKNQKCSITVFTFDRQNKILRPILSIINGVWLSSWIDLSIIIKIWLHIYPRVLHISFQTWPLSRNYVMITWIRVQTKQFFKFISNAHISLSFLLIWNWNDKYIHRLHRKSYLIQD